MTPPDEREPSKPTPWWLPSSRSWGLLGVIALVVVAILGSHEARQSARVHGQRMRAWAALTGRWVPGRTVALRVVVRDDVSHAPLGNAQVEARVVSVSGVNGGGPFVQAGPVRTADDGVAQLVLRLPPSAPAGLSDVRVDVQRGADLAWWNGRVEVEDASAREIQSTLVTDKARYQPGDTIRWRLLALADGQPLADEPVSFEVFDPRGTRVLQRRARTSAFGIASAECPTSTVMNLGRYRIKATLGDAVAEHHVAVMRTTLPRFRVTIRPEATSLKASARVEASYFFGRPVRGADVKVLVAASPEGAPVVSAGKTDTAGAFTFDLPPGGGPVRAEVSTFGMGTRVAEAVLGAPIGSRDGRLLVSVIPESGPLVRGVENRVLVLTTHSDGTPARARVAVNEPVQVIRTSTLGVGAFSVVPRGDDFSLKPLLTASNEHGARGYATPTLPVDTRDDAFVLHTDRNAYPAGGRVKVTVRSLRDGRVFLDVVRLGALVASHAVNVSGGQGTTEILLPKSVGGLLAIHASRFSKPTAGSEPPRLRRAQKMKLVFVGSAAPLDVQLQLDAPSFAPGARAPLRVLVKQPDGTPATAAVSLAAVDEATVRDTDDTPWDALTRLTFDAERFAAQVEGVAPELVRTIPILEATDEQRDAQAALLAAASVPSWRREASKETELPTMWLPGTGPQERVETVRAWHAAWRKRVGVFSVLGLLPFLVCFAAMALGFAFSRSRTLPRTWFAPRAGVLARVAPMQLVGTLSSAVAAGCALTRGADAPSGWLAAWAVLALTATGCLVWAGWRLQRAPVVRAHPSARSFAWSLVASHVALQGVAIAVANLQLPTGGLFPFVAAVSGLGGALAGATSIAFAGAPGTLTSRQRSWKFVSRATLAAAACGGSAFAMRPPPRVVPVEQPVVARVPSARDFDFGWNVALPPPSYEEVDRTSSGTRGPTLVTNRQLPTHKRTVAVRSDFPETLLWLPDVSTDAKGVALVDVPLADSITTWRVTATAVSAQGALGAQTTPLRARQDFFAALELPHDLTVGDEVVVPVSVFNYGAASQRVAARLSSADGLAILGEQRVEVDVGPDDVSFVSYRIRAMSPGKHRVTLRVDGEKSADAVERVTTVHPDGREVLSTRSGVAQGKATERVTLPADVLEGGSELRVKVYPNGLSEVAEGIRGVFQKPHGCFEQTSATTYPSVLALRHLRAAGLAAPTLEEKALETIGPGYQRLLTFEKPGGGFALFQNGPPRVVLTAYGLIQLTDMAKVHPVDPALVERTRAWLLERQKPAGTWEDGQDAANTTAYVAWVLAETGWRGDALERALDFVQGEGSRQRYGREDAYRLALAANALIAAGRTQRAGPLLSRLQKARAPGHRNWSADSPSLLYSFGESLSQETTALVALALHRAGGDPTLVDRAFEWLMQERDEHGTWASPSATVAALRLSLARANAKRPHDPVEISVLLDGAEAARTRLEPANWETHEVLELPGPIRPGEHEVALAIGREGSLNYQLVTRYLLPWRAFDAGHVNPFPFRVDYSPRTVAPEDVITCAVQVGWSREAYPAMWMVEVGVPPGAVVVEEDLDRAVRERRLQRHEMGDRHVMLYGGGDLIHSGPVTFRMVARTSGRVTIPASRAYPYYEPELRAWAPPTKLQVHQRDPD